MKQENKGLPLKEIYVMDNSGGVQSKTVPALSQNNQVLHCINGIIGDKIGGIVGRHGSIVKNVTGKDIVNIGIFRNGTARKYFVIASDGSNEVIYTVPNADFSGTLTSVQAGHWTDDNEVYSTTFAKKEMFFNGLDTPQQWTGSAFSDITDAPTEGKYPEVFQQRLFVLATDGFLHYSDVINATGDGFTTTDWSNRGINPNDGQRTRALKRHRGRLIIFKDESIYRYDGANEPEPIINIGTHSERGVVRTDTHLYFHHPSGIYQMSLGDPQIISRAVQKYIDGMNSDNWDKVSSGRDNDKVYFNIGDVTIKSPLDWDYGVTYENVTLVYDVLLERWQVWTNWEAVAWIRDTDNGVQTFFDNSGNIVKIDKSLYTDRGKAIDFQVMWHPISYGIPYLLKQTNSIILDGKGNINIMAGSNYDKLNAVSKMVDGSATIKKKIIFKKLWVMATATYKNSPPLVEQLSIGRGYARNRQ